MPKHPNVLVLMCDQMQSQRMGFVDGVAHTPTLDRLAAEGVHFSNAYTCQGQCVPARAAFQTGLPAHECGVMVNYGGNFFNHTATLGPQHVTLGHAFKQNGYDTAYFGKSHLGVPLEKLGYEVSHACDGITLSDEEARNLGIEHVPEVLRNQYTATQKALAWLQAYEPGDKPLFLTYSTNLPHPPFYTEPAYADLYPLDVMKIPASYSREAFEHKPPYQKEHANDGRHGAGDEASVKEMTRMYYTMISQMDTFFGQIVTEFERLGLWDNTVVLFFSDHGDMLGAHGMIKKGTLPYEELYRIPCILRLPKNTTPERKIVTDLVSTEKFAGTLLKAAGLDLPSSFRHGHMLDTVFTGKPARNQEVFFEHYAAYWGIHPFYGIRTPSHKYVRYYGPDNTEELYHLETDPDELCNLAGWPDYALLQKDLAARADAWWKDTGGRDFEYYESDDFKNNKHNQWSNGVEE